jgi:glycosyltransferase involved in cell wall biosynthesis
MTPKPAKQLGIIVPCFNEQEMLPATHERLASLLERMIAAGQIASSSRIYYVDDGSTDDTWKIIDALSNASDSVVGLRLSRNFGHQNAVMAGLLSASGDALISIDADLQDDIDVIPEMLERFQAGDEIVYGVRRERQSDTALKRGSALLYYRLLKLLGVDVIHNHADFRLMSRKAVDCLKQFSEVNLFLRGIVPLLGFQTGTVEYDRQERTAGQTKYNLRRMIALAINGITSFSPAPLRMVAALGLIVFLLTVAMTFWVLWIRFFTDQAIPGWASSVIPIYFLGGLQLLSIGVLGEYISKLYLESKQRPRYFIAETTGDESAAD